VRCFGLTLRELLRYGLLVACAVGVFWHRLVWMGHLWWSDSLYSLSAVVPLISLGIANGKRKKLAALQLNPSGAGIALVMGAAAITVATDWFDMLHSLTPLLVVSLLCGIVLALWGTAILKELLFPIAFLLLLVPVPPALLERIDLPLQILCARAVAGLSHTLSLPVERMGSLILFPGSGSINVAPACNGVRSALTMLMLAIIFVYLSRGRWYSKFAVVAAAVPLAYFANLVRLFGIVSGAHLLGGRFLEHEQTFDHVFGLLVFGGCVGTLLTWARIVKCRNLMQIW
jgi:exosortase